ncbi:MAG: hypothetical protein AB9873_04635 [Syntrophobacteraceae bacterium]
MQFESLLSAIEQYASARDVPEVRSSGGGSDWDCGLSGEFGEAYSASWARGQKLAEARERLRKALDEYIDERVRLALRNSRTE